MEPPIVSVGSRAEYAYWEARLRRLYEQWGARGREFERVDARYNYRTNRITLYQLADPHEERSVADTLSHEILHAVLFQEGERDAARAIDLVGRPVGDPTRRGGI